MIKEIRQTVDESPPQVLRIVFFFFFPSLGISFLKVLRDPAITLLITAPGLDPRVSSSADVADNRHTVTGTHTHPRPAVRQRLAVRARIAIAAGTVHFRRRTVALT